MASESSLLSGSKHEVLASFMGRIVWVNSNGLTVASLESWIVTENSPQVALIQLNETLQFTRSYDEEAIEFKANLFSDTHDI